MNSAIRIQRLNTQLSWGKIALAAVVLVPINFRLNADEIAYIVEHSGASVLLVG